VVRIGRGHRRVLHAEGIENVMLHVAGIGLAGRGLHHIAGEGKGEVRVLPLSLGGEDALLARETFAEALGGGKVEVGPVGEGRLARKPRGMGEQMADRDGGSVHVLARDGEPRQVAGEGIVELEPAHIAKLEDGGGGEGLGDGSDPVERVAGGGDAALDIGPAEALRPDQSLVVHDAHRGARQAAVRALVLDPRGHDGDRGPDFGTLGQRRVGSHDGFTV
jgi:hypothetical protein